MKTWLTIIGENPWLKALVEFSLFTSVGVLFSLFLAYSPSLDDILRGAMIGLILACFSLASSRITQLHTRTTVKNEERQRTARFLESTLTERLGEPITSDTVVQVARQVTKEDRASDCELMTEWKEGVE